MTIIRNIKEQFQNGADSIASHLPRLQKQTQSSFLDYVQRIKDFVLRNKTIVFFAVTVAFAVVTAPATVTYASMTGALISGAIVATASHVLSRVYGVYSFADGQSDDKVNVMLGVINLFTRISSPAGVAISLFTAALVGSPLAYRKLTSL